VVTECRRRRMGNGHGCCLSAISELRAFDAVGYSVVLGYWEARKRPLKFAPGEKVNVPVAIAHFPREIPIPPRKYVERGYNVTRWTEMPKGGHFAASEEPESLANDIRAFAQQFRL
jgi:pimeloyl-ACP methyl ester carboxylesterase